MLTRSTTLAILASLAAIGPDPAAAQSVEDCPTAVLLPPELQQWSNFGVAMAADGETLIVGADGHAGVGPASGAVFAFRRTEAGLWQPAGELVPNDLAAHAYLGASVAISGERVVCGAPLADSDLPSAYGSAYVFELGSDWQQVAKLSGNPLGGSRHFGAAVSIDGDSCVVGAPATDQHAGAAYTFRRTEGGSWVQTAELLPPAVAEDAQFGTAVAIDGQRIAIGAPAYGFGGAVVTYRLGPGGWQLEAILDPPWSGVSDFGTAVALEGDRLLVGAPRDGVWPSSVGAVYAYEWSDPAGWTPTQKITNGAISGGHYFGQSLDLQGDRLAIGAPASGFIPDEPGAAHEYVRQGNFWVLERELRPTASAPIGTADEIGSAVALTPTSLAVGGRNTDTVLADTSGVVTVFGPAGDGSLVGCPQQVSLATGGEHRVSIELGAELANQLYLLLGSATGTAPGIAIGALEIPLSADAYTTLTATAPNLGPLVGTFGTLDADGRAASSVVLPSGTDPSLAGLTLYHACIAIDPFAGPEVTATTVAATLTLVD